MGFVGGDLVEKRVRYEDWKFWEKGASYLENFVAAVLKHGCLYYCYVLDQYLSLQLVLMLIC